MFDSLFPSHWSDLKKLMWLKILKGGTASYETITGNPVSFSAIAAPLKQLQIAFSPKQDLHGYDAPWPAGGGKNKFDNETAPIYGRFISFSSPSSATWREVANAYSYSVKVSPNTTYAIKAHGETSIFRVCAISVDPSTAGSADVASTNAYSNYGGGSNYCTITTSTEEQWLVIQLDATVVTNRAGKLMVEIGSTFSPFAPYSNICPISGWSSLTVEQRGKNLWDEEWELGYWANGEKASANTNIRSKNKIPISPNTAYYLQIPSNFYYTYYDADGEILPVEGYDSVGRLVKTLPGEITTPYGAYYMTFNMGSVYGTTYNNDISINYPSTDHDYHAYNPSSRSISISLGSTVYSGYVDVISGMGMVDKATVSISADMIYNYNAGRNAFTVYRTAVQNVWKMDSEIGSTYSFSHGVVVAQNNQFASVTNGACCGSTVAGNQEFLFVKLANSFSDLDTAKAYVTAQANNGTPLQVCYYLATPIPIQLTPQEVESLAGDNTMWSDANGDLTVEYRSA